VNALVSGGYLPQAVRGTKSEDCIYCRILPLSPLPIIYLYFDFFQVFTIADWYATFCALAGVDPVDDAAIAGMCFLFVILKIK
jgi:hypothetical protein